MRNKKTNKMKFIGFGLLLVIAIRVGVLVNSQSVTIANLEQKTKTIQQQNEIIDTHNKIISLKEHKFTLCKEMGMDLPVKLIGICPEPTETK